MDRSIPSDLQQFEERPIGAQGDTCERPNHLDLAPEAGRPSGPDQRVFIVDDDPLVRETVKVLLSGFNVNAFSDATTFLMEANPRCSDCLITDVQMPDMSGIDLQHALNRNGVALPIIVLTGHADVPLAVEAMKAGAIEFIQKPFDADTLRGVVSDALREGHRLWNKSKIREAARRRLESLTERELEVFQHLAKGYANKAIAYSLAISPRTIEVHRGRIQEKLGVFCLAELVRIANEAEIHDRIASSRSQGTLYRHT